MTEPLIRRALPGDWAAVERICADTGRVGDPVDEEEREEFARHWVGPYKALRPEWTFVAVVDGEVVAYLTGCPDTLAFERERQRAFKPGPDSRQFFPEAVRLAQWTEHPAHLHMNVDARHRRHGLGGRLLRAFFAELRRAGVPSAHVVCGPKAAGYWERMAFRTTAQVEAAPGLVLRLMSRATD